MRFNEGWYLALQSRSLDLDEISVSSSAPRKAAAGMKEQLSGGCSSHLYPNPAATETEVSENRVPYQQRVPGFVFNSRASVTPLPVEVSFKLMNKYVRSLPGNELKTDRVPWLNCMYDLFGVA
ncbi:unnamed protein product [Menidia menidia]|uniref:(Atlantic silverside) hypothetical protein n=1 Tax=Menidia menidia TaxID=238744 RepID=A0A8S4AW82_9TELE|nr:unnamed protein product [Menidia menidia]